MKKGKTLGCQITLKKYLMDDKKYIDYQHEYMRRSLAEAIMENLPFGEPITFEIKTDTRPSDYPFEGIVILSRLKMTSVIPHTFYPKYKSMSPSPTKWEKFKRKIHNLVTFNRYKDYA